MGPTRNSYSDGTTIIDASTSHADAHAAWNACVHHRSTSFQVSNLNIFSQVGSLLLNLHQTVVSLYKKNIYSNCWKMSQTAAMSHLNGPLLNLLSTALEILFYFP